MSNVIVGEMNREMDSPMFKIWSEMSRMNWSLGVGD